MVGTASYGHFLLALPFKTKTFFWPKFMYSRDFFSDLFFNDFTIFSVFKPVLVVFFSD